MTPNKRKKRRRLKKGPVIILVVAIILIIAIVGLILFLTRHKHTPGPEASCTSPQICTECDEVLVEALGHDPGAEATCVDPQVCKRCNEVLVEALGHTEGEPATCMGPQICIVCNEEMAPASNHKVDENGVCSMCNEQIMPAGQKVHAAGAGDAKSDDTSGIIAESEAGGHYNSMDKGYYKNAVLVCGDYGVEYMNPSSDGCSSWANVINGFAQKYPQLHVSAMIVPKCATYHVAPNYDNPHDNVAKYIQATYDKLDSNITAVDAMSVMDEHADEYMFYRTDHHWTSLGAYYSSVAYCQANDITPFELDSYETTVQTDFQGTLYYYGGKDANLKKNLDYTVFHYPHTAYSMVYYAGGSWVNASAFNTETSSYATAFICGDQPIEVFTTENNTGKSLMIFKESYGNGYAPYMLDYYDKVIVVDIRTTDSSVTKLINDYGVTDVLFINNIQGASSLTDSLKKRCMD